MTGFGNIEFILFLGDHEQCFKYHKNKQMQIQNKGPTKSFEYNLAFISTNRW